jgi:cytochrome c5
MKSITAFMIVAFAASLLACGKSDDAAAPATAQPAAEATRSEPVIADTVEPLPTGVAPVAAPAASSVQSETKAVPPADTQAVAAGSAATEPAAATSDLVHGQKIYVQACAHCHDRGIAGAPKTGDVATWNLRMAPGMESLYNVAIRGKGAMPAKGGNRSLSDADVKAAVDYMVAQSR